MQVRKTTLIAGILAALYGAAIGIAADTPPTGKVARPAKDSTKDVAQAVNAPEPGSPGDTLTREDKRMAYLYQMNFGDEDRRMEAYYDEITLDEMKDIAGYAQTLP